MNGIPEDPDRVERVRLFLDRSHPVGRSGSGQEIARGWLDAILGESVPVEAWLDGSWEQLLVETLDGIPAPGMRGFLRFLLQAHPSGKQRAAIAEVITWYIGLWEVVAGLTSSEEWRRMVLAQLHDYAGGRRISTFRPYYEDLSVPAERFAAWEEDIQGEIDGVVRDSRRWRTPFWELRAALDGVASPWSSRCACGGSWYLLLGDTGHRQFDQSSCSLCVGVNDSGCGMTIVDVRD